MMNNELKKTLTILKQLNQYVDNSIVKENIFQEEDENIKDLNTLDKNTENSLDLLKKETTIDAIMEQLCQLDVNLALYDWHFEQVRDLTEKFIGLYREKNALKDIE